MRNKFSKLRSEFQVLHFRVYLVQLLAALLPAFFGGRLRAYLLAMVGFSIGQETVIFKIPSITGSGNIYSRLRIGRQCLISVDCFLDLADNITLEDRVVIGPQVMILTGTHRMEDTQRRGGELITHPVRVGSGCWIGARCTILPGVTIGQGAVIGAGALVNKDIPANMLAGGVPAVVIREL